MDESFNVTLTNASGDASIVNAVAEGMILNDDAAKVASVVIADPTSNQRSLVDRVTVTFAGSVTFAEGAFAVAQLGAAGGVVNLVAATPVYANGQTQVVITFNGDFTRGNRAALIDGNYQLTIDASKVLSGSIALDGDGDGVGGDNYVIGDDETDNFFAYYGDLDGDRMVGLAEFNAFRASYGKSEGDAGYNPWLDYEGLGSIGVADFSRLRSRYGRRLN
jgi:hypothetical protein